MIKNANQLSEQLQIGLVTTYTFTNICQQSVTGSDKPETEVSMATTCSSATTDGGIDHGGSSSNEREPVLPPRFGMKKGVVQRAGHILWKGKYIDQNEFYKVRPSFYFINKAADLIWTT